MSKRKRKKNTVRSKEKYPQFNSRLSPKVRAEYMDYADREFAKNLPEDEYHTLPNGKKVSIKEWYHKFVSEFDAASLDYKNLDNNIHNTKELKKECTDRNNSRNRCIYGLNKAGGRVIDTNSNNDDHKPANLSETEDTMIDIIDRLYEED